MTTYLLAGGGTAGHVNPLLATADALRERDPAAEIIVLGSRGGLEERLVPAHGYELKLIEKVPFPRRLNGGALRFPRRFLHAVRTVRRLIADRGVAVVVGFGGYAATPAYVAARRRVPVVVHEANAMPGLANRLGARWAARVAVAFSNTPLPRAVMVGMPLRKQIAQLDREALRPEAISYFGLDPHRRTLVVTGGSLGAKRINDAVREAGVDLTGTPEPAGSTQPESAWQVVHIVGQLSPFDDPQLPNYHVVEYCDRMDLAFAAADLLLSRAGASTVSEILAVGLPAVYVPYAVGNGEQAKNIASVIEAGAARTVSDAQMSAEWIRSELLPLMRDDEAMAQLAANAAAIGINDAAERLAELIGDATTTEAPRLKNRPGRSRRRS